MLGSDRLSSVHLIVKVMGSKRKESLLATGLIFLSFAFVDFLPAGPWLDASFSRGMSGLLGLSLIYLSWFEYTFGELGVVPTIKRWKHPESTWRTVTFSGIGILALSWISGNTMVGDVIARTIADDSHAHRFACHLLWTLRLSRYKRPASRRRMIHSSSR